MDSYLHLALVEAIRGIEMDPSEETRSRLGAIKNKIFLHASSKRIAVRSVLKSLIDRDLEIKWKRFRPRNEGSVDTHLIRYVNRVSQYLADCCEDLVRRMEELCSFFDIELTHYEKEDLIYTYQLVSLFGGLVPQMKYSLNLAFNWFWDEVPPVKFNNLLGWRLFPRKLRLRIKQMKKYRHRVKNQIRMNTLFQGFKKGLMPIDPDQVDASLIKHSKALTNEANTLPDDVSERSEELLTEMISEVDPQYDPDLYGLKYVWRLRRKFNWNSPLSRKATYDFSFGAGGNVAYLLEQYGYDPLLIRTPQFVGYCNLGFWDPTEVRAIGPSRLELVENDKGFNALDFISSPACILEPMKARIITKPFQGLHLGLSQLQKDLWSYLYNHHSGFFRLIGETLTRSHLWPILIEWDADKYFCSGDFSAATDNLKQEITKMIYCKFFERLLTVKHCLNDSIVDNVLMKQEEDTTNSRLFYRGLYSLTSSKLDYSRSVLPTYPFNYEWESKEIGQVDQINGQLMGNVLSFPILCIANYLSFHISYEKFLGKKVRLWKTPKVLINGDDILFVTTAKHYAQWQITVNQFGLEPSVGKNYFNQSFLQINSELWIPMTAYSKSLNRAVVYDVYKCSYVNFGMMTHRRKQDCSTDLSMISNQQMVGGINKCIAEQGGQVTDGWLSRLQNLVTIRRKLLMDLPKIFADKASKIFDKHCRPIFDALGLAKFYFGNFPEVYIDSVLRKCVAPISSLAREIFPEFECEKLNSELYIHWDRIKMVRKSLPYYFPFGSLDKPNISRTPSDQIADRDQRL